jgi:hypothetical protein
VTLVYRALHTGPGLVRRRLLYLLFYRWRWAAYDLWVRFTPCDEHDPYTRRIGKLRELLAGEPGRLQTVCGRCRRVLREWSEAGA